MSWARQLKESYTSESLCIGEISILELFVNKVFSLTYYDKPQYDELISILEKQLKTSSKRASKYGELTAESSSSEGKIVQQKLKFNASLP